jgi:hypothetical protein
MAEIRYFAVSILAGAIAGTLACSSSPASPTSPTSPSSAAEAGGANTVGVSLKVSEPVPLEPAEGQSFVSTTVTVVFEPARPKFVSVPVGHELTVRRVPDGVEVFNALLGPTSDAVAHTLPALDIGTYDFLVRGALGDSRGGWSLPRRFTVGSPSSSAAAAFPPGVVGPPRNIPTGEAIQLIINLHDRERWNLGSRSTREDRVAFLWRAVAVLHYGHPVYNPAGADADWCVKDAGAGRPPSDDVIVRCSSRESWDIMLSAGGDGYHFHEDYLGRLGGEQNVYPPPRSSLPR